MMRAALCAAMPLIIAGCGAAPTSGSNEGGTTAAPVTAVTLTSRSAPKRADGYWELKTMGGGGTLMGTQFLCVGGDSEEKAPIFDQIAMNVNCSKHEFTRIGDGWNFDTVCGPTKASTKGTITGDFAKAYRIEMAESDGSVTMQRTVEARHAGVCPAGVTPGDLMNDKGGKITNTLP